MKFSKNFLQHQWRENGFNLNGKRPVFAKRSSAAEDVRNQSADLSTEYVHGQDILQNSARELDREISAREKRGLIGRIVDRTFRGDTDELKLKRDICGMKLDILKKPIQSNEDFEESLNDISSFNRSLNILRSSDLDEMSLGDVGDIESGLGAFFGTKLSKKVEGAKKSMAARETLSNLFVQGKGDPKFADQARGEWAEEEKRLKERLKSAKKTQVVDLNEVMEIEAAIRNQTNWINRRIAELEAERRIREGETAERSVRRLTREVESEQQKVNLSYFLDYENKREINNILLEAREMREARVREFLQNRFKEVNTKLTAVQSKRPPRFNDKQARQFGEVFGFFKKELLDNPAIFREGAQIKIPSYEGAAEVVAGGTEALEKILFGLDAADKAISGIDEENEKLLEKINADPAHFKEQIRRKFSNVKNSIQAFTPERIDALLIKLDETEKEKGAIYRKKREALLALKDENSPLKRQIAEVEAIMTDLDSMELPELVDTVESLDRLQEVLLGFSGEKIDAALEGKRTEAQMARLVINKLAGVTDPDEIKKILKEHINPENLDYVNNYKFRHYPDPVTGEEKDLKEFTSEGGMVFYERQGTWKIIINLDIIKDGNVLNKQITHELKHLEFDKNDELKAKWLGIFTKNPSWPAIKDAFIKAVDPKKPPVGNEWRDEDVLGEIYAMQDDVFAGKNKFDDLRKSIVGAGIADKITGVPVGTYHGYEEGGAYHGMEGAEPSEGGALMPHGVEKEAGGSAEISESAGGGSYEFNKEQIAEKQKEIERLLKTDYLAYMPGAKSLLGLMKKYNEETNELNEKFKEDSSSFVSSVIKGRVKQVDEDTAKINAQMGEIGDQMPNVTMNPLRDTWNRTTFLSFDDIFQVAADIKEWWERRHKRKKADHAGRVGAAVFSKLPFVPYVGEFGEESKARQQKAEHEEVNEWKSRLENKDAWELIEIMHGMAEQVDPNKDALKAILRVLAEKGRFNTRDQKLWTILNKLQNKVSFIPGDETLLKNPILLRQKMHTAIGEIWDYDEFFKLEKDNESNYEGNKQKYMATIEKMQDQITPRLDQLLKKHRNGGRVDPMEYEALIEYSITKGKSYEENVFFHLIVGMADGLLSPDRGMSLDRFLNQWPATQWIYRRKPPFTKNDYYRIANTKFKESYNRGSISSLGENKYPDDFMNFYWTEVQNAEMTVQRVRKHVGAREWDHDWGRTIAPLGDANTAKRWLSGKSGQQEVQDTAVENAYTGALQWLEENAKSPHKIDAKKEFTRQMSWITMTDGIMDGVAYYSGAGDSYTRATAGILDSTARLADIGRHKDWTTRQHRDHIRDFLNQFDRPFFDMIRDRVTARDNKAELGIRVKNYLTQKYSHTDLPTELASVKDIDDIFNKMDAIIKTIVYNTSDKDFQSFIAAIAPPKKGA